MRTSKKALIHWGWAVLLAVVFLSTRLFADFYRGMGDGLTDANSLPVHSAPR